MTGEKTLAFDLETLRLASEVAEEFADELRGKSPWDRPDLFGFGVGCTEDVSTGVAYRHRDAGAMLGHLRVARRVVSYSGESFDLGVLSAYGDVAEIRAKHIDINALVRAALDALPEARNGEVRIRQGGLHGLSKANGFGGKIGSATHAPELLRHGKVEEVLSYCEADARLVAGLYRIALETGKLSADAYYKKDGERVELGRLEVPVSVGRETTRTDLS